MHRQSPHRERYVVPLLRVALLIGVTLWATGCFGPMPPEDDLDVYRQSLTVGGAVTAGCSTAQVDGLTRQLFAEVNCLRPNTLSDFGGLAGVKKNASHVYTMMQPAAINSLKKVLARRPGATMNITSALRSIAQQYLLYKWYRAGRCSIGLAATPGNSNHQSGLALDVSPYSSWTSHFQAIGWRWLGSKDPVHFDYTGSGTINIKSLSIKAFQRLWNKNNPNDKIAEDGAYGPQTEARLAKSPATGFPTSGCVCSEGATRACGKDTGACKKGTQTCTNGAWGSCKGQIKATAELCDGKDNDCDGQTDEGCDCTNGDTKACGGTNTGTCKKGNQTCASGKWGTCKGEVKATTEVCDGKDNDCDGSIDNGVKTGETCQTGQPGECSEGKTTCENGKPICKPNKQPDTEQCNDGKDNNCDGNVDEGCSGCTEGEIRDCGSSVGECLPGKQLCENGKWGACGNQAGPTDEICDGKDNDCDGKTDEDIADIGQPCDTGLVGNCQNGTKACKDGKPLCAPPSGCGPPAEQTPFETPPLPEPPPVLDAGTDQSGPGVDRGVIKVGPQDPCKTSLECPTGQACISGQCVSGLRPQGCGCASTQRPPAPPWWLLLALLLPLLRRRKWVAGSG